MNKIFRDILILLSVIALIWIAITLWIRHSPEEGHSKKEFSIISEENEIKIAKALRKSVFEQYDTLNHPALNTAVDSIKQRLTEQTDKDYNIYILQDSSINAFATLQGDIFLFTGLIEYTPSAEMLASVIAHEMGHIREEHFVHRMSQQIGLQTAILILTGGDAGTIAQLSKSLLNMQYSRKQEREADKIALQKLEDANVNPQNLTRFFIKLNSSHSIPDNQYLELFMTHPSLSDRIRDATEYKTDEDFHKISFGLDWPEVQEIAGELD